MVLAREGRFEEIPGFHYPTAELRPEFPDCPRRIHWSISDPAVTGATDRAGYAAFRRTAAEVDTRIRHLLSLLAHARPQEVQP